MKRDDQPDRLEIYQKTVEVLGPEVAKLKDFYYFQARAIDRFGEEIRNLAHPEKLKGFVSQTTKLTLGRMINMFAVLDALKKLVWGVGGGRKKSRQSFRRLVSVSLTVCMGGCASLPLNSMKACLNNDFSFHKR